MAIQESWNSGVAQYCELPDVSNVEIIFPAVLSHLGPVNGRDILDYGCGEGRFARQLRQRGAQVTGVDLSGEMIDIANARSLQTGIQYRLMSENSLSFIPDESFDACAAILVFMMSQKKADILQSMREIHRVLRPQGKFVYAITHPCFVDRGAHDYRNVFPKGFNYMQEGYPYKFILQDAQGNEADEDFTDYHYNLTTYLNLTMQAGFKISGFEELTYPDEVVEKYGIPKDYQTFPQALIVVGQK